MRWTCALVISLSSPRIEVTSSRSFLSTFGCLKRRRLQIHLSYALVLWQADLQRIGHCCGCGITACKEDVDDLVSNKTYILMLSIEIMDERVFVGFLFVVTVSLQGILDKLVRVLFDSFASCNESFWNIHLTDIAKSKTLSSD